MARQWQASGVPHITPEIADEIKTLRRQGVSWRAIGRRLNVSRDTAQRALSRIAERTRTAADFKTALSVVLEPPTRRPTIHCWDLPTIRQARDAQMRGDFSLPVQLAKAMRTDDALFVAYHNRIAPHMAVDVSCVPASGTRGEAVARKSKASVFAPRTTLQGLCGTLANHGVAIGYVKNEVDDAGTRIDFKLTEWPLEHVKYNSSTEQLETSTKGGQRVTITHGDGRWIVFRKTLVEPWTQEACILPGALVYAAHANGLRDWAATSASHGQAKIVGELPEGVSLQDTDGLTPEAAAFLQMLQDIVSGEAGAGVRPAGSETDFLANGSNAWQVFTELVTNREKAAARIYLGTDGTLGTQGGAPGVDISALFGVATTKIQGDFLAIEQAINTGLYQPWCAVNEGDSRYAPSLKYEFSDPDAVRKGDEEYTKLDHLLNALDRMKNLGLVVNQETINQLCHTFSIRNPPKLAPTPALPAAQPVA